MDYKKMYIAEKRRSEILSHKLQEQVKSNNDYYAYILKQNAVIELLKQRLKEAKGLR